MRNTLTTNELYEALIQMPDLHSMPELDGTMIFWNLYKNAFVRAYCDSYDTCIEIISTSGSLASTHWHPDEKDMLSELYSLGKKGNLLVLKKTLFSTSTFYIGPAENDPISDRSELHFGKKKWDGGQLICLEQK